ncbi:MAG TPA: hypothetical protein PKW68_00815, partial [bacterium]|nr:hypothetical protein [bacterium]
VSIYFRLPAGEPLNNNISSGANITAYNPVLDEKREFLLFLINSFLVRVIENFNLSSPEERAITISAEAVSQSIPIISLNSELLKDVPDEKR